MSCGEVLFVVECYCCQELITAELQSQSECMSEGRGQEFMLGDYKVGKCIGQGTFGKVCVATHIPTNQHVAIKTLQKERIADQGDIERVTREITILKVLRHPNVVQLYQIIQTPSDIHLVMEYAEGGQLFDHIVRSKRLSDRQANRYFQQILAGIEYIHRNGVVHRDLKPENLLFDQYRNIKLVDFGLSNHYKRGEKLKTACGSPCYAAPEMIAGKQYESLGVDIWSCGIILYAMLCGFLPFQDPNTSKLYKKIKAGEFQLPNILSREAKELLKGILNTNPETRYGIEQIRNSRWFTQGESRYEAGGILVGIDRIQFDSDLVHAMQKKGIDPNQVRNYVTNNRHNHITAYYYLLNKKMLKDPAFAKKVRQKVTEIQRSESPLIYKPEYKKSFAVQMQRERRDRDESFNAGHIINALVQTNKAKLATDIPVNNLASRLVKKNDNFDKIQQFKLFPKKRNSSIYEQNTTETLRTPGTSQAGTDEKNMQHSTYSAHHTPGQKNTNIHLKDRPSLPVDRNFIALSQPKRSDRPQTPSSENIKFITSSFEKPQSHQIGPVMGNTQIVIEASRKQQELSKQLRQISEKIDKSINELKHQNNNGLSVVSNTLVKSRQINNRSTDPCIRLKTQSLCIPNRVNQNQRHAYINVKMLPQQSFQNGHKNNINFGVRHDNQSVRHPQLHIGPFNACCMFMDDPANLLRRIVAYLWEVGVKFTQTEGYTLELAGGERISIESLQGVSGCYLLSFLGAYELSRNLVNFLNR